jgi:predicted dehydrogenase
MRPIRVGIIGANPDRGWAAQAHIPALKSLSEDFEITALSTSRRESADAAGKVFDVRMGWGPTVEPFNAYLNDKKTGATMLSTAVGGQYQWSPPQGNGPSANVAQAYAHFARDYRDGTHLCPTFDDAVTRHHMLDAIETAAATGQRQTFGDGTARRPGAMSQAVAA